MCCCSCPTMSASAMSSAFGGPVPTPNFERLAAHGPALQPLPHHRHLLAQPRRAADRAQPPQCRASAICRDLPHRLIPAMAARILPETATIAQVLQAQRLQHRDVRQASQHPAGERSEAGPFDDWPTGLGFEYFFGFPHGDTDQYSPDPLSRHLARRSGRRARAKCSTSGLADDIIRWVHNQKAGAPDKPFLLYLAPGSTHAPHQAPPEYIARFKGKFDQGWDKVREETWRRQLASGIIPRGTKLTAAARRHSRLGQR